MKNLNDYIDDFRMITTLQRDGGDSCAHGCAIDYGFILIYNDPRGVFTYAALESTERGRYRRHPDPSKWYSNPDTLSRDQLTPLLCLLGLVRSPRRKTLFLQHLKRGLLFAWNVRMNGALPNTPAYAWKIPDITAIDIHGAWIRAFRFWPFYPLLLGCDIPTLIGAAIYRFGLSTSTLQMNQVLMVDYSNRIMPTPISWLAKKIYGKAVPTAALNHEYGDATPNNPPVNQYLVPLINNW